MCVARYVQITQNNKSDISLHHFKEEISDDVDFFHAEKHGSLLQIYTNIFDRDG